MKPIRVMIVDDSALVRQVLSAMVAEHPGIKVIAVPMDPLFHLEKMQREWPDVLLLDVEMPRMDVEALKLGAVERVLSLDDIPAAILASMTGRA